ncbi:uncharacterized protein LOC18993230 [Eutrema salsugineum]|uniref:uncharacterized protein LOC18993230 n=1 Tax=Eutrema salsugineum TaxID=72664 RepID=UPI000CED7EFA|nr:uncharacterized protein LOC18993230 [Eutrema salsugineum]
MASSLTKNKPSVSVSSSSPCIPCRPNSKPRNSETGDLMRRSFRANPFPADLSLRNSTGREISRVEFGDKENQNDKDQNSNAFKTPKGAKNFMSPTISAVSKINPSPRKKILSDKNDVSRSFDKTHHHQVRSSVSFSDVVSFIGEDTDQEQICVDEKKQLYEEESHDITHVTDFDENHGNKSNGDFDDSSPLPPSLPYTFPVLGSHEVDSSVAPYDPKKNYLSPRPQFLHYRPNPRIEHHFDECKQLEELFNSESSSSESDLSAEDSQLEEEVASQEVVVAVEEEAEVIQDKNDTEHSEAVESDEEVLVVSEGTEEEETHQISKQSLFKTSKLLGWILVLGVSYLLLVSPVTLTQPNISQASHFLKFHIPVEITKSATESFEQLSVKLRMWAESSFVYMDKLISSLREKEGYGPFQYHNLTDILVDTRLSYTAFETPRGEITVAGLLVDGQKWSLEMDMEEDNGVHQELEEPENSGEIDLEYVDEEDGNDFEQESEGGEVNSIVCESDKQTEFKMDTDTDINGGEGYSESLSEDEESGDQEADGIEGKKEYEEIDQKNLEEVHESETRSAQNDVKNIESEITMATDTEMNGGKRYSESLSEEEESGGQETDGFEGQREYEANDQNNMEAADSDAHQLDDVESAAISGHQQIDNEVANPETGSEEEGIMEIAESSDVSAEVSDVDGGNLEEESSIGDEVVNTADWKEILLSNQKKVVVLFSTVMVLLAAASGFLLAKKKAKPVMMLHEDGEPRTISDAKEVNFEQVPVENLIKERLPSLNFQEEEDVDDDREREVSSFPSEMSFSFHKNKSLHSCNNRDDLKEYQSGGGRKSNDSGESTASSASEYSIGSVSYGSFTTYEKIQKRSGRKEEMVTPVRRSSRIRNHQHSGQ